MASTDRNLLFGILALQNNLITREALVAAFNTWIADKSRDLSSLLLERKQLTRNQLGLLTALADELVKQLGTPEKCLAQLSSIATLPEDLIQLSDPDLQSSLRHLTTRPANGNSGGALPTIGLASQVGSRFRILRPHAKGGLGLVSVAHDSELNREVALKEIQDQFADDQESRARFLLEAEITGGLEHPGIVPVYALGQYADGRPFYAMRFIRGDSLKDALRDFHASSHGLSDTERNLQLRRLLQRFIDVCEAMHYAHSRGVLHRDLKPGNIMLGKYGETLVVDWGLARTAERATDKNDSLAKSTADEPTLRPRSDTSKTQMGDAMGTPQFMSPEQATGRVDLLGPATDIYSLGATLYVILVGQSPVVGNSSAEILQNVQQGNVIPPRRLKPLLPKPLEAICLRALAFKPGDRYATARALADDLEHWLADEPVDAYQEPLALKLRRGLRKRPMVTGSIFATLLMGLLSFALGMALLNHKNQQLSVANTALIAARNDANQQAQLATQNAKRADTERNRVRKAMDLLVAAFRNPDPEVSGREIRAADLLLQVARSTRTTLGDEPLLQAELYNALWQTLTGLGLDAEALPIAEEAARLRTDTLGASHPDTLLSRQNLASAYHNLGQYEKALLMRAEAYQETLTKLGPDHMNTLASMANLASSYSQAGDRQQAIKLLEEAFNKAKATFGPDDPTTLGAMNNLAQAYGSLGQQDKALTMLEETYRRAAAALGPEHPNTLKSLIGLATAYSRAGRGDKAFPLLEETLEKLKTKLGPDHPETLGLMNTLAGHYNDAGLTDKVLPLFAETYQRRVAKLGPDHPDTLVSLNNLAGGYFVAGQIDKSVELFEESLTKKKRRFGSDHPDTIGAMQNLARIYQVAKRPEKSEPLLAEALETLSKLVEPEHPQRLLAIDELIMLYLRGPNSAKAIPRLMEQVDLRRKTLAPGSLELYSLLANSSYLLLHAKGEAEAEDILREALELGEMLQPDEWSTFSTQAMLGTSLASQAPNVSLIDMPAGEKLFVEAEANLKSGLEGMLERLDQIPAENRDRVTSAAEKIIELYSAWKKPAEAEKWKAKLAELQESK